MQLKKILQHGSVVLFTLVLVACGCNPCPPQRPKPAPCDYLISVVRHDGVQVIQRGDTLRLILPVDNFFEPASNKIRLDAEPALNDVGALVQCACYNFMSIHVAGYTDNIGTIHAQEKRSLQQARNIASYLWSSGVPLARMSVRGYGARGTVSANTTPRGEADNRRVEIQIP